MRRKSFLRKQMSHEFDLDLAPLLSVMVKLVPVLLLSSAFVQVMVIETELPQAVQQALQDNELQKSVVVKMKVDSSRNAVIEVSENNQTQQLRIPASEGRFNYTQIHDNLVQVKAKHPQIFRMEIEPDAQVSYSEIVKLMDEARIKRDKKTGFEVLDKISGKTTSTYYMFPDVVFSNIFSG